MILLWIILACFAFLFGVRVWLTYRFRKGQQLLRQRHEEFMQGEHLRFIATVAGVTFKNPDGTSRQDIVKSCRVGEFLTLAPEPTNPYDNYAIAIFRIDASQVGYLPRDWARQIAERGETCDDFSVSVIGKHGGTWGKPTRNLSIELLKRVKLDPVASAPSKKSRHQRAPRKDSRQTTPAV